MSDLVDPASDPELATLAKQDAEVAAALEAERVGSTGDFGTTIAEAWDQRTGSDARWDATALEFTVGGPVEVHRADGSVYVGTVRSVSDGKGWWRPVVTDGKVQFEDGTALAFDDIVSVSSLPDAEHAHDLGPVPGVDVDGE
jgi:hypothetical protein